MRDWEKMSFREQLRANLGALFSIHAETVSPHWPVVRAMAEREAQARLATYQAEISERVERYGRSSHRVLEFSDRRFTRAVGR